MNPVLNPLLQAVLAYPADEPAETDTRARFLRKIRNEPDCLLRDNRHGHLTGSAWVLHADRRHVLMLHHRKLDRWLQPGGHADGDPDLEAVARREVLEETGIDALLPLRPGIFDLDIHPIPARGDVPAHLHFDVRFAFTAPAGAVPRPNPESHATAWVPLDPGEPRLRERSLQRMLAKSRI